VEVLNIRIIPDLNKFDCILDSGHRIWSSILTLNKLMLSIMGNLLYTIAVILIIIWAIGYFGYQSGGIIHLLLVIALIAIILKVIRRA
jgi:type IV secretory pathway VirB2 component (pilin)